MKHITHNMKHGNKNKLELLAPAGNLEKMKVALAHGADAVYAGIPDFSLRVRINDFDLEKIKEAAKYCRDRGKKIYITVNIFAHNRHLEKLPPYIRALKKINVDALIISDPGIIALVKNVWPDCEIHLSTQANCTNWQAAKFWHKQGIKRVILGREVTLAEIKEIHKKVPQIELEYFVHGAMCMAYSGRCFLSQYFVNRSGNLGDCVQPCRWKYNLVESRKSHAYPAYRTGRRQAGKVESDKEFFISEENRPDEVLEIVEEEHGSYILNSKDLCLLKYLNELKKAGITSFKIEGRAKSAYYQAMVAGIYSRVTHSAQLVTPVEINKLYKELEIKITHRGYTTGFLLGDKADQELEKTHQEIEWEFCGIVCNANAANNTRMPRITNKKNANLIFVKVHNTLKVGDEIEIVRPFYDIISIRVERLIDSKTNKEISEAHGGAGGKTVILEVNEVVPEFSVLRRKIA